MQDIKKYLTDFLCGVLDEIKQMPRLEGHYIANARGAVSFAAYLAPEQTEEIYDLWVKTEKELLRNELLRNGEG